MSLTPQKRMELAAFWPRLARSLEVYHNDSAREALMVALYRNFLPAQNGLAFDIGAHVGDRVAAFRALNARVVALEPQPDCASVIREIFAQDEAVKVLAAACGDQEGKITLDVNSQNPTVTTASAAFIAAAQGAAGWEGQVWDQKIEVDVTTLDALIAAHGVPDFIKIDVEGFEATILRGLTRPVPALSYEFTTIQRDVAVECLEILAQKGQARFNVALGETQSFVFDSWCDEKTMRNYLLALPHEANSGDVYAVFS